MARPETIELGGQTFNHLQMGRLDNIRAEIALFLGKIWVDWKYPRQYDAVVAWVETGIFYGPGAAERYRELYDEEIKEENVKAHNNRVRSTFELQMLRNSRRSRHIPGMVEIARNVVTGEIRRLPL